MGICLLLASGAWGNNLLKNPGFEDGMTGWETDLYQTDANAAAGVRNEEAVTGKACGFVKKGEGTTAALKQRVAVEPNRKYVLGAFIKGKGDLLTYEYDANAKFLGVAGKSPADSTIWRPISAEFTTKPETRMCEIHFELYRIAGTGYVDDIYFGLAENAPAAFRLQPAPGKNRLHNPGFEAGMTGWEAEFFKVGSDAVAEVKNENAAAGQSCGFVRKGEGTVAALKQRAAVEGGKKFLLSAFVKGKGHLLCYEYNVDGKFLGVSGRSSVDTPDWRPVSVEFTTHPEARMCEIRFELFLITGEGFIDDVYFGEAPAAPAPGALRNFRVREAGERGAEVAWEGGKEEGLRYLLFRARYPDGIDAGGSPYRITETATLSEELPDGWENGYYAAAAFDRFNRVGERSPVTSLRPLDRPGKPVVWVDSVLHKIRRYAPLPKDSVQPAIHLSLAKNETESAQILIAAQGGALAGVEASFTPLDPRLTANFLKTGYVPLPTPPLAGATPGLYPDPLPPLRGAFDVPPEATQSLWFQVTAAPECPAGVYSGSVTLRQGGREFAQIPVEVKVRNFALPVTPSFDSSFGIYGTCGFAEAEGVEPGSEAYRKLLEKYYWFLVERRLMPRELPVPPESPETARFLNDPRVRSFNLGSFSDESYNKLDKLAETAELFRRKNQLGKAYVYALDEPPVGNYGLCIGFARELHKRTDNRVPHLLTVCHPPAPELFGSVDIWSLSLNLCDPDFIAARQKAGEKVWWYTCNQPQAPYPTYLVDDSGVSHRLLSWLQVAYNIEGLLYWGVDVWKTEWKGEPKIWKTAAIDPHVNGDGFLLYPGKPAGVDGPVTSLRLEIIRDGNEDVEYFNLLKNLLKKHNTPNPDQTIKSLINPLARTLTDWNTTPAQLEQQRNLLATEIERLISL